VDGIRVGKREKQLFACVQAKSDGLEWQGDCLWHFQVPLWEWIVYEGKKIKQAANLAVNLVQALTFIFKKNSKPVTNAESMPSALCNQD
jgi:hypothetical protein